jgi:hypothetical protein
MTNLVRVEAEFSDLATRSGVISCVDGVLEQELRKPPGRVGFTAL